MTTPAPTHERPRARALAAIEHAIVEHAQKITEQAGFEWSVDGVQFRSTRGGTREIVIRLQPFETKR